LPMRNHLARNECCAALGRFGRLTGSLRFPRIGKTKNAFDQEQVASEQAPIFLFPLYSRLRCRPRGHHRRARDQGSSGTRMLQRIAA